MSSDWEGRIVDPKKRRVFEALSDPEWDFRTVAGLSKATGLPDDEVEAVLREYSDLIRKSPVRDSNGRELYALRSRSMTVGELLAQARTIISKSVM